MKLSKLHVSTGSGENLDSQAVITLSRCALREDR